MEFIRRVLEGSHKALNIFSDLETSQKLVEYLITVTAIIAIIVLILIVFMIRLGVSCSRLRKDFTAIQVKLAWLEGAHSASARVVTVSPGGAPAPHQPPPVAATCGKDGGPACRAVSKPGAKFCAKCGRSLTTAPVPSPAPSPAQPAGGPRRKRGAF